MPNLDTQLCGDPLPNDGFWISLGCFQYKGMGFVVIRRSGFQALVCDGESVPILPIAFSPGSHCSTVLFGSRVGSNEVLIGLL